MNTFCYIKRTSILIAFLYALFLITDINKVMAAGDYGTKEEAVEMVEKSKSLFEKEGLEALKAAVMDMSNKEFHYKDLYAFIYDFEGNCLAHGVKSALVGKNLIKLKDQEGVFIIKEMIDAAKANGSGWVDYKWPNPKTNKIVDKSSYVVKIGDNYFVGVGFHK